MYWEGYLTIMQLLLQVGLVLAFLTRTWIIFFRCIFLAWKSRVHFTENMIVRIVIACKGILSTDDVLGDISFYIQRIVFCVVCTHWWYLLSAKLILFMQNGKRALNKRQTAKNTKHWKATSIGRWPFFQWPLLCLPEQQIISEISNKMYK